MKSSHLVEHPLVPMPIFVYNEGQGHSNFTKVKVMYLSIDHNCKYSFLNKKPILTIPGYVKSFTLKKNKT